MDVLKPSEVATRVVLSIFIVFHLVAMTGSAFGEFSVGKAIREYTRPYERAIGVHQTWPMFVHPSKVTAWLRIVGEWPDGTETEIDWLIGEMDPDGVIWLYHRTNKLERSAIVTRRDYLRATLVRWVCREHKEAGTPLKRVAMQKVWRQTPPPAHNPGPRASWPVLSEEVDRWNCR